MVKISLQIEANLENIDELYTIHPEYNFLLKLKCLSCGEVSDKWHDVMESQTYPTKMGKNEVHYLAKCKLCSRENSLDILPGTNVIQFSYSYQQNMNVTQYCGISGKFTSNNGGKFVTLVTFDCRGIEPVEFSPAEGWIAKVEESGKVFEDVDLSEKEWADYDDKANQSVGIYEFESQFVKVK